MPTLSLKQYVILAATVLLAGVFGWSQLKGKFYAWRAGVWKERATEAAGRAALEESLRKNHEAAARNTRVTRDRTDLAVADNRAATEQDAQRYERENDHPPALGAGTDAAAQRVPVVVEYENGASRYRAAADRLQRARAGRAGSTAADD